jgi:hypothetical protein
LYVEHLGKNRQWFERFPLAAVTRVEQYSVPIRNSKKSAGMRKSWRSTADAPHLGLHLHLSDSTQDAQLRKYVFETKRHATDFASDVRRLIEFGPLARLLVKLLDAHQLQKIDSELLCVLESIMGVESYSTLSSNETSQSDTEAGSVPSSLGPASSEHQIRKPPTIDEFVDWFTCWAVQHRGDPILVSLAEEFACAVEKLENESNCATVALQQLAATLTGPGDVELSTPQRETTSSDAAPITASGAHSNGLSGTAHLSIAHNAAGRRVSLLRATAGGGTSSHGLEPVRVRTASSGQTGGSTSLPARVKLDRALLEGEQLRCHEQRVRFVQTQEMGATLKNDGMDKTFASTVQGEFRITNYCVTFDAYECEQVLLASGKCLALSL